MERSDVIILGGGLVGLTLAAALGAHGLSSFVVDPADPDAQAAPGYDGRATAIASASWQMLVAVGVGARLAGQGCAIEAIRVSDGLRPGTIDFAGDGEPLGTMFENRALRAALRAQVEAGSQARLLAPARPASVVRGEHGVMVALGDERVLQAALLVGADGRGSPSREEAGLRVARWSYDHAAIVATIEHEDNHANTAYEIFYPAGPFAILPMLPGTRSAIVWSVDKADAPGLVALGERAFAHEIEKRMGGFLGKVRLAGPRISYPLGFHHAARITAGRLALVGDAAHGIHPIAGQGLNLGLRDVAALTEVLVEGVRLGLDPGDPQLLDRYERWRALDTLTIAAATDGLTRLYGIRGRTASAVRRLGMTAVDRAGPLKTFFTDEARGTGGTLPALLRGMTV